MDESNFKSVSKFLGENAGAIGSGAIILLTGGVQQIATVTFYRCPCVNPSRLRTNCANFSGYSFACTAPLNYSYGLSLILTPALALLLFGVIINVQIRKSLTGCLKKSRDYRRRKRDIFWTLMVGFTKAFISPTAWICIALLDGRFLACALTHLPYDVGQSDSLYATCEKLSEAKVSYPSDAFRNNRAFSQVVGAATVACLFLLGFFAFCISKCTFPLTYYHAMYFGTYRKLEEVEFEVEMKKKALIDAEQNVKIFLKEKRGKELWDRISTVFQFHRDKNELALYSQLYTWVCEEKTKEAETKVEEVITLNKNGLSLEEVNKEDDKIAVSIV